MSLAGLDKSGLRSVSVYGIRALWYLLRSSRTEPGPRDWWPQFVKAVPKLETHPEHDKRTSRAILVPPRIWQGLDSFDKNLKSKSIRACKFISLELGHPSLQIKLVKVQNVSVYRARVDPQHRIHFELAGNHYLILEIGGHRLQGIG